jgi:hypothetical protein
MDDTITQRLERFKDTLDAKQKTPPPAGDDQPEENQGSKSGRRALAAAMLATVAGSAILSGVPSKEVNSQLSPGDVQMIGDIIEILQEMLELGQLEFDLLTDFFRMIDIALPAFVLEMINLLISLIGTGNEATVIAEGNVAAADFSSYPTDVSFYNTPAAAHEQALIRAGQIRQRIVEAQNINATAASRQGELAAAELEIMLPIESAPTPSLPALLLAQLRMQQAANARLGHLSIQMAAIGALLFDRPAAVANDVEMSTLMQDEIHGTAPEEELPPAGVIPPQ